MRKVGDGVLLLPFRGCARSQLKTFRVLNDQDFEVLINVRRVSVFVVGIHNGCKIWILIREWSNRCEAKSCRAMLLYKRLFWNSSLGKLIKPVEEFLLLDQLLFSHCL